MAVGAENSSNAACVGVVAWKIAPSRVAVSLDLLNGFALTGRKVGEPVVIDTRRLVASSFEGRTGWRRYLGYQLPRACEVDHQRRISLTPTRVNRPCSSVRHGMQRQREGFVT